jgi:hypothetical protein
MMLSVRPDLVPAERPQRDGEFETDPSGAASPYRDERHGWWRDINGFTDSPASGSAQNGDRFRAAIVAGLARAFAEFYRS